MMTWFANSFVKDHHMDLNCLNTEAEKTAFSHDYFFHSLIGILEVNTSFYNEKMDLFIKCPIWKISRR